MSLKNSLPVGDLTLDLRNFRTIKQRSEAKAAGAMISTSPDRFWALTNSLLDDGFLPTENIIVLKSENEEQLVVREGNRRIAAMKLIHGLLKLEASTVPSEIRDRIDNISDKWRKENTKVPCVIYEPTDAETVDRLVTLAHGKGEKAGRDQWNTVARARHNRDMKGGSEPGLDLLEKYLKNGKNLTPAQAGRWSGDYPLTVLDEALKKLAPRLGLMSAKEVAKSYPSTKYAVAFDNLIHDIGQKSVRFREIRSAVADFAEPHGFPAKPTENGKDKGSNEAGTAKSSTSMSEKDHTSSRRERKSTGTTDPRSVKALLRSWSPRGKGREKVVDLRKEALNLDLRKTPLAFCFVLRSMFEVSAKAYCTDHQRSGGPSSKKENGVDKSLAVLLKDVSKHLTRSASDQELVKTLHGATTELSRPEGLLSVTSMNQLVHNPSFSIQPNDICILFGNVFPLLRAMNQ